MKGPISAAGIHSCTDVFAPSQGQQGRATRLSGSSASTKSVVLYCPKTEHWEGDAWTLY